MLSTKGQERGEPDEPYKPSDIQKEARSQRRRLLTAKGHTPKKDGCRGGPAGEPMLDYVVSPVRLTVTDQ